MRTNKINEDILFPRILSPWLSIWLFIKTVKYVFIIINMSHDVIIFLRLLTRWFRQTKHVIVHIDKQWLLWISRKWRKLGWNEVAGRPLLVRGSLGSLQVGVSRICTVFMKWFKDRQGTHCCTIRCTQSAFFSWHKLFFLNGPMSGLGI